jgi:hypothetical protein
MARLECCQPHFRTYSALIDRDVVSDHDTRSTRLDALRRRFLAGLSPLDDLPEQDAAPEAAIAA